MVVDEGATRALLDGGKSLLAVGVVSVDGDFGAEAAVDVIGAEDQGLGKGLMTMSGEQARELDWPAQLRSRGVMIHRDDFVLLAAGRQAADRLSP